MRSVLFSAGLAALLAIGAMAAPAIDPNGVMNGASLAPAGLPGGDIAQGSIFAISGKDLGPEPVSAATFPLPAAEGLGGVTVDIAAANGQRYKAVLLAVSSTQITAILPSVVPAGAAAVTVNYRGTSAAQAIRVVRTSVGIFAGSPLSDHAMLAGDAVTVWATGLGAVTFPDGEMPGPRTADMTDLAAVTVYVGGIPVRPDYAGRSTGYAGLDQINFTLPPNAPPACYVPVYVKAGGIVSNTATVAITRGIPGDQECSDDFTLPSSIRQGIITAGIVSLTSIVDAQTGAASETGSARFSRMTVGRNMPPLILLGSTAYGTCSVYFAANNWFASNAFFSFLDAGPSLNLHLPDGLTGTFRRSVAGAYALDLTNLFGQHFLTPGSYRLQSPGGTSPQPLPPFERRFTVAAPPQWKSARTLSTQLRRDADLTVAWDGGDPQDVAVIAGRATTATGAAAGFYCLARTEDKQFTIPREVLSTLPRSTGLWVANGWIGLGAVPTLNKSEAGEHVPGLDLLAIETVLLTSHKIAVQ